MHNSENLALVMVIVKSSDSANELNLMLICAAKLKILLAFSHWVLRRLRALALFLMSNLFFLDNRVIEFSANESLGIEDGVVWVFGSLIFGSITDEPFGFCKGDIRRSGSVSLVIGDDFDSVICQTPTQE